MCKGLEIYSRFMFHMLLRTFPFADLASWTSDLYMRNIESNSVVLVFERHCTMDNLHSVPSGTTGQIYSGATNTRLNLLPSYSLPWVIEIQVFSSPEFQDHPLASLTMTVVMVFRTLLPIGASRVMNTDSNINDMCSYIQISSWMLLFSSPLAQPSVVPSTHPYWAAPYFHSLVDFM